jgi:hypothetical protein
LFWFVWPTPKVTATNKGRAIVNAQVLTLIVSLLKA